MRIRPLQLQEWDHLAEFIHRSTNAWYDRNLGRSIFPEPPAICRIFPETYEALDPGCCLIAEDEDSGVWMGSCFFHPRPTHVSVGIINTAPQCASRGVAKALIQAVLDRAGPLPVRLVSSALNLDSYSLYSRLGFTPRELFQDMLWQVPLEGPDNPPPGTDRIRPAQPGDLEAICTLDHELTGIRREKDFHHLLLNPGGVWRLLVSPDGAGRIEGFLASVDHPGSCMLGPGCSLNTACALALIWRQWQFFPGKSPVFLVPASQSALISQLYRRGARNCELHLLQVLGDSTPLKGIVMPSFLPETL